VLLRSSSGRVDTAKLDDQKCQSYGSRPGEPAYVQCRSQLDAARTQAQATIAAAPIDTRPSYRPPPISLAHVLHNHPARKHGAAAECQE
jgi:hypothetical protein